jgi:hypothetical protein
MNIATTAVGSISFLLFAVATGTLGWAVSDTIDAGLFHFRSDGCTKDSENVSDSVNATRAMMIIATLFAFLGAISALAKPVVATVLFGVAGVAGLIAVAVFANYFHNQDANKVQPFTLEEFGFDLNYSFALAVVSFLFSFAALGLSTKAE